ncbi:MAG: hypothetical protein HZT43_16255 [Exiguobacterium profundum]|nr:MAG: hypothetical protein HZT43_16255 [Exiguobacterium profundum]
MLRAVATLTALCLCAPALAQDATFWSRGGTFLPWSATAESITGPITLAVDAQGAPTSITFGPGAQVGLTQVALSDAAWLIFDEAMVKGAVLQMAADPGPLINGNTLCGGPDMARWLVLAASPGSDATLQLAAFSGDDPLSLDPERCPVRDLQLRRGIGRDPARKRLWRG